MKEKKTYRVYLKNTMSLGSLSGYGEGKTRDEAMRDALRRAYERDKCAFYDPQSGCVCFAEPLNL